MRNGYDLYPLGRTTPTRSFTIEQSKDFIKSGAFAEKGKVIACGSDHGRVYVFNTAESEPLQILRLGDKGQVIQAVAVCVSS